MKVSKLFGLMGGEVVSTEQPDPNQLIILARIIPGDGAAAGRWAMFVDHTLEAAESSSAWQVDISRQYTRSKAGRTIYYWRWIFSGDVAEALKILVVKTRQTAIPVEELTSFPTVGRSASGPNEPFNGTAGVYTAQGVAKVFGQHGVSAGGTGMAPRG